MQLRTAKAKIHTSSRRIEMKKTYIRTLSVTSHRTGRNNPQSSTCCSTLGRHEIHHCGSSNVRHAPTKIVALFEPQSQASGPAGEPVTNSKSGGAFSGVLGRFVGDQAQFQLLLRQRYHLSPGKLPWEAATAPMSPIRDSAPSTA